MQIVVTTNFGKLPPGKQKYETLNGNSFRLFCFKVLLKLYKLYWETVLRESCVVGTRGDMKGVTYDL